jgi:phytoene synthase
MKNSTFMAAASAVGGSIWVGVEGSMLMGFAAVAVYLLLTLAIQLCKDKYEPKELKITRALNPKWKQDMEICEEMMRKGSKSFFTASKLLPPWMREPTLALYAYCRHGDDTIDDGPEETKVADLKCLYDRLDVMYNKHVPVEALPTPVERTFAAVVRGFDVPKDLPLALLEGFEWDMYDDMKDTCRYETLEDTIAYSVRVASAVGGMMVALMPKNLRRPEVIARAFDLGIGMQLTNISRDVGEDARNGRVYLPAQWLKEAGVDRAELLQDPTMTPQLGRVVKRLLDTADVYYTRSDAGIKFLPADCQLAVQGAGCIYGDIGRVVRGNGYDSVSSRAFTSKTRKLFLLLVSYAKMLVAPYVHCSEMPAASARYLVEKVCASEAGGTADTPGSKKNAVLSSTGPVKKRRASEPELLGTVRSFPMSLLYTPVAASKPHTL